MTPPDGQSGVMNMYLWNLTPIERDGSLDSMIPIHEYMHGVTNRMIGSASTPYCLQTNEAMGLGEGWSDILAVLLTRKGTETATTNVGLGNYVLGYPVDGPGIRRYPYTTSMTTNPMLYADNYSSVHDIGTVWASILYEVYFILFQRLGFSSDYSNPKQTRGNIAMLRLVITGLTFTPCNPTMVQARDAILQAEKALFNGVYRCNLWKGFAKRGLGFNAPSNPKANDFTLPAGCA